MVVKVPRPCGTCAMPRRTTFSVDLPESDLPSNSIAPVERTMLQIARSVVVLPAPLAPSSVVSAALVEGEAEAVQRLDLAVIGAEILDVEHRGHWSLLPR